MFEKILADIEYQSWLERGGPRRGKPMLPGQRKKRGRSPVKTQFQLSDKTWFRDWQAWYLRHEGHTYADIALALGYCRQSAQASVRRAHTEYLITGGDNYIIPGSMVTSEGLERMPKINLRALGLKTVRNGRRGCGCYLPKGKLVCIIDGRQWCIPCALGYYHLTWTQIEAEPTLIGKLKLPARGSPYKQRKKDELHYEQDMKCR